MIELSSQSRGNTPTSTSKEDLFEPERLFHEINLLKIKGRYFCFDKRTAAKREGENEFWDIIKKPDGKIEKRPIRIEPHPKYGHPSTLTYKVLQAILRKLSSYGYPVPDHVSFGSERELARLIGRESWGSETGRELLKALNQLENTQIHGWVYDKELGDWMRLKFSIVITSLLAGKRGRWSHCSLQLHPLIINNLNRHYFLCLNYSRMAKLEPIASALYERLFYHFARRFSRDGHKAFPFIKDYAGICEDWLGSLTVKKHKSKISDQLGSHLARLKETKLLQRYMVQKNAKGDGFNILFYPGTGFFDDYKRFVAEKYQHQLRFEHAADERLIQQPLELVAYFYEQLYPQGNVNNLPVFSEKETTLASLLLEQHSFDDIKELIDYALTEAPKTNFAIKTFGGIKQYVQAWVEGKEERSRSAETRRQLEVAAQEKQLAKDYEAFKQTQLLKQRNTLSPVELKRLEEMAREEITADNPHVPVFMGHLRAKVNRFLEERTPIPSFEQWKTDSTKIEG